MQDACYRYWSSEGLSLECRNGTGWHRLDPEVVFADVGWVSTSRCLRGELVRASGVCRPMTRVVSAEAWTLELAEVVKPRTETFGSETREATVIPTGCTAVLRGWVPETFTDDLSGDVLALLSLGVGALAGVGSLVASSLKVVAERSTDTALTVDFDLKEVHHVPA